MLIFYRVVDQIKNVLGANPMVMTLPIGIEDDFSRAWFDLLTRKAWVWDDSSDPLNYKIEDVPADMVDKVRRISGSIGRKWQLDQDDDAMEKYLDGGRARFGHSKRLHSQRNDSIGLLPNLLRFSF